MSNLTYSQATSGQIGADVCSAGEHVVFRTIGRGATRLKTESRPQCSRTCQGDATAGEKENPLEKGFSLISGERSSKCP